MPIGGLDYLPWRPLWQPSRQSVAGRSSSIAVSATPISSARHDGDRQALDTLVERYAGWCPASHRPSWRYRGEPRTQPGVALQAERTLRSPGASASSRRGCIDWSRNTCRDLADRQRLRRSESLDAADGELQTVDRRSVPPRATRRSRTRAGVRPQSADGRAAPGRSASRHARPVVRGDRAGRPRSGRHREVVRPPGTGESEAAAEGVLHGVILTGDQIEAILPDRDPFLLLDEVVALEPGSSVVARKRGAGGRVVSPRRISGETIMPGVLMVEAFAQTGAVAVLSEEGNRGEHVSLRASTIFASSGSFGPARSSSWSASSSVCAARSARGVSVRRWTASSRSAGR